MGSLTVAKDLQEGGARIVCHLELGRSEVRPQLELENGVGISGQGGEEVRIGKNHGSWVGDAAARADHAQVLVAVGGLADGELVGVVGQGDGNQLTSASGSKEGCPCTL
jgi:hypothetical protein